jgi:hypothetical protein
MSRSRKAPKESPAKRFRTVLFHMWEKDDDGFEEFDLFYEDRMEKLIEYYTKQIKKK